MQPGGHVRSWSRDTTVLKRLAASELFDGLCVEVSNFFIIPGFQEYSSSVIGFHPNCVIYSERK